MLPISKVGRASGAGEYYLAGVMSDAERFTGKVGQFYGPTALLIKLGLTPGQETDEATFRCLLRGMDPAKGKVAFHPGGQFNPQGLLLSAWSDAAVKQRKAMIACMRKAGIKIGRITYTSASETVLEAWSASYSDPTNDQARAEAHVRAVFRAAANVPGYTLVHGAGPERQTAYDLTLTLPKDLSVLYSMASTNERAVIEQIVRDAGNRVIDYLNTYAAVTRSGKGGAESIRGRYLASCFVDFVARPVDMRGNELPDEQRYMKLQDALGSGVKGMFVDYFLHNHIVLKNLMHCDDGRYRAIDGPRLYQAQAAAGMLGMAYVAQELKSRLGITTRKVEGASYWEIPDIARSAIEEASKRSQIIALAKDAKGLAEIPQREIGKALWDLIKLETREDHVTLTNDQLDAHVKPRMEVAGHSQQISDDLFTEGSQRVASGIRLTIPTRKQVIESVDALLENESVFSDHKLRAQVLSRFCDGCDVAGTLRVIDDVIASELVHLGEFDKRRIFTSSKMLALEANYLDIALHGRHVSAITEADIKRSLKLVGAAKAAGGKPMSEEQASAARYLLSGKSVVSVLVGPAGAGKTYTLETVQHCLKSAGYTLLGCALSWSAAEQLRAEGKLDSAAAVAKLCYDIKQGKASLNQRTCIVIDEGSLVSSREMGTLLIAAHAAGSKVIVTGDPEQIQAVGAGAPMRAIVERCGAFELQTVRRQIEGWDRQAGLNIRAGGDRLRKGMAAHISHGRLRIESSHDDAVKAMFKEWLTYRTANPGASQLMVSRRNRDCDALNGLVRESLRAVGLLGQDHMIKVAIGKESKVLPFATGDFIQFRLKSKETQIYDGDDVINGEVFNRTRATIKDISVNEKEVMAISVELWSGDQQSGRTTALHPEDFRNGSFAMEHAYAVTPDSAQGMTVDRCLAMPGCMDQEHAYVALSRHRRGLMMFVSRDEMHAQAARYMERTEFTDRNDFTDELATEALIAGLLRKRGKQTSLDYLSDKARYANLSCLAGTRFEHLVRTDHTLANTWRLLSSAMTATVKAAPAVEALSDSTGDVVRRIGESGLTGKFCRPSFIHSSDYTEHIHITRHLDREEVKRGLIAAKKFWGKRIWLSGRKRFHEACIRLSKELGITFGTAETLRVLKEFIHGQRVRNERNRRAAWEVANSYGFGFQSGLSGSVAFAADGARVVRKRDAVRFGLESTAQRMQPVSAGDVVLAEPATRPPATDGLLRGNASDDVRGRRSERDRLREPVWKADSGTCRVAGGRIEAAAVPARKKNQGMGR